LRVGGRNCESFTKSKFLWIWHHNLWALGGWRDREEEKNSACTCIKVKLGNFDTCRSACY
jgi:hypothetical protein